MSLDARPSFFENRRLSIQAARAFLFLALAGASYLAFVSLSGAAVAGCGPGSGCNQVLATRWAYWMGIPVSLPAIAIYLSLLAATWRANGTALSVNKPIARFVIVALSGLIVLAAGWFGVLQYAIIRHWCKFCLATHASALLAVGLLINGARAGLPESVPARRSPFRPPNFQLAIAAASLGLAILMAGQFAVKKPLYNLTKISGKSSDPNSAMLMLYNGQFELDPAALPLMGSSSATNYIVSLFDYTCSHCRRLHPLLRDMVRSYSSRLAVISLPVPLDAGCNPLIQETNPANLNACDYARLSLAVWHARPAAFAEFDDWLFDSDPRPSLAEARAKAEQLAGKELLAEALGSSWVSLQLKKDVNLYLVNSRTMRNAHLPQLIFGDAATGGSIENMDELMAVIHQHAPLTKGAATIKTSQPTASH